jgi:hypothetical protein
MPRLQVYLPNDLYREVKSRSLPASELLQEAVRRELDNLRLSEEREKYIRELEAEVGPPTPQEAVQVDALVERIAAHLKKARARRR